MSNDYDIEEVYNRLKRVDEIPVSEHVSSFSYDGPLAKLLNALSALEPEDDPNIIACESILDLAENVEMSHNRIDGYMDTFNLNENEVAREVRDLFNKILFECKAMLVESEDNDVKE